MLFSRTRKAKPFSQATAGARDGIMYVVGTAGHVDHGKSTLVEALTGIDPDRLAEEKERGLTIDLGFAWLRLPSGNEVSVVDVPGHERFVNNMLAGVGGIDLALLVVAADESVMPQTREHLAILDLLRIPRGVVALTKKDLVDDEWLELVEADVEDALDGTSLADAPIIPVSAHTGEGLDGLTAAIESALRDIPAKRDLARPRLPIDRAFTITGFGTVVTGTLIDGHLSVGQDAELAIAGRRTRVRGLQTHKNAVERAEPGTRVAANLIGVARDGIFRGETLTAPGWLRPTAAFDVRMRVLADAPNPLRHNMSVTVHTGSSETVARLRLFEEDSAAPGETVWAQLRLESPAAVAKGDYFVIRSNMSTLGGGNIVDTHAPRPRRRHAPTIERLKIMETGDESEILLKTVEGMEPAEFRAVVNRAAMSADAAKKTLEKMASASRVVVLGAGSLRPTSRLYTAGGWRNVEDRARAALSDYHAQFPLRAGAPKEELRSRLRMTSQIFADALALLKSAGVVSERGSLVRLPEHAPTLSESQREKADEYLARLASNPFSPPTDFPIDPEIVNLLDDGGEVVKAGDSVVFSASAYSEMSARISDYLDANGEISVGGVRDMFGASRKYALALMDHLDRTGVTRRVGDVRVKR